MKTPHGLRKTRALLCPMTNMIIFAAGNTKHSSLMKQTALNSMKRAALAAAFVMALPMQAQTRPDVAIEPGPFQPSWQSLEQWECPAWFSDAKFGIFH